MVACQAPLSIRFSRQEYWSGLSFPSPGIIWTIREAHVIGFFWGGGDNYFTILWWFFAIHQHESAIGPSLLTPPPSPPHPSRLSQSTGFGFPASYSKLPLAICFTYGNVCVSLLFSQIIPLSFSPTVSKSLFFVSVSSLLSSHRVVSTVFLDSIYMC